MLYKNVLRDLIVRLGIDGAIKPRWTARIDDEWIGNLLEHRPDLRPANLERTRALMHHALPEALISVTTTSDHALPDPDDQHVLDAALSAEVDVLLTFNLADFPGAALPTVIQAVHPDQFLCVCLEEQQDAVLAALHRLRVDLKSPPLDPNGLLAALVRAGLPTFAERLQAFKEHL